MSKNIVIGVGGTGAKVVEAMLHLSAAGVGPGTMDVGFIDQDKTNGNVARSIDLLKLLVAARASWRTDNGPHHLGRAEPGSLLRTLVEPIHQLDDNLWVPDPKGRSSLRSIFANLDAETMLMDMLFSKEEQEMELDGGYKGKPHIGAAAITAHAHEDRGFWRSLVEKIGLVGVGQEVRLLLTGSVFGGTGAAGFPTVARLIRAKLKENNIQRNVSIGGVLMLPYFSFGDPSAEDGDSLDVARAAELLTQSRGALRHYEWQLGQLDQGHLFDELYFVGWNHRASLDYHVSSAGNQKNPALLPELFAAAAGYRFLNADRVVEINPDNPQRPLFVSARHEDRALSWADLPPPDDTMPQALYARIAQFLRFATAFLQWRESFGAQPSRKAALSDLWYRVQGLAGIDWERHPPTEELRDLSNVIRKFLEWAGSIEAYAGREDFDFGLWDLRGLVTTANFKDPVNLLTAPMVISAGAYREIFGRVATRDEGSDALLDAAELADLLNDHVAGSGHAGLGKLVHSLHAFSAPGVRPKPE